MHGVLSIQSCLTLCDPMDCSPPGSSVHGDSPGKDTRLSCHALLQGIFPIQGSNLYLLHLLHWQVGSLPLAPPGKPLKAPGPGQCLCSWYEMVLDGRVGQLVQGDMENRKLARTSAGQPPAINPHVSPQATCNLAEIQGYFSSALILLGEGRAGQKVCLRCPELAACPSVMP